MRSRFSGVNDCQKRGGDGKAEREAGVGCSSAIVKYDPRRNPSRLESVLISMEARIKLGFIDIIGALGTLEDATDGGTFDVSARLGWSCARRQCDFLIHHHHIFGSYTLPLAIWASPASMSRL